jgi:hypothetical protein
LGLATLVLIAIAVTGAGCAAVSYRVPGTEVQRLAQVPPMERGAEVRVVPRDAPLHPSTAGTRPPPPPPPVAYAAAPPPAPAAALPPGAYASEPPPFDPGPDGALELEVDVDAPPPVVVQGPVVRVHPAPVYVVRPAPVRPPPVAPTVVVTGGGWRGAPAAPVLRGTPPRVGGGWRGSPVVTATRAPPSHPVFTGHRGGFHSSGRSGGGGGSAAAVAVGVVAVVGLVAALAVAADHADRVEKARTYDGWIRVAPTHPIHLHYGGDRQRVLPLCELQESDTLGLQWAVIRAAEGPVEHLVPAPAAPPVAVRPPPAPPPRAPASAAAPESPVPADSANSPGAPSPAGADRAAASARAAPGPALN